MAIQQPTPVSESQQMAIRPVESYLFEAVQRKFYQTFGCPTVITNGYEKTRALQTLLGGKVQYPYALIKSTAIARNQNSYPSKSMARRAKPVLVMASDNTMYTAKLMPALFTFEVEYSTDQFDLSVDRSVLSFARRWLFASVGGYLKFELEYGMLRLGIDVELDESLTIPERPNIVEQETAYKVIGTFIVKGYISEPQLQQQGKLQELDTELDLKAYTSWNFDGTTGSSVSQSGTNNSLWTRGPTSGE